MEASGTGGGGGSGGGGEAHVPFDDAQRVARPQPHTQRAALVAPPPPPPPPPPVPRAHAADGPPPQLVRQLEDLLADRYFSREEHERPRWWPLEFKSEEDEKKAGAQGRDRVQ